jgi:hypothetical protein
VSYILKANETEKELTARELTANCALLLDAGSETTATMLSGKTYREEAPAVVNLGIRLLVLPSEESRLHGASDEDPSRHI